MRNVLTVLMVVVGFALQGISYFVLADPWVTTGIPSGEPRLIAAPTLFIAGVVLVFRDVTIAHQAQQTIREQNQLLEQRVHERTAQLHESEDHLRSVISNVPAMIAAVEQLRAASKEVCGSGYSMHWRQMSNVLGVMFE